ncbi:hypothetical protein DXG01_009277 [Tephrocybe rancida]|nr:hypothetical protein DXG01_009277 [Tephrocybe rancida]
MPDAGMNIVPYDIQNPPYNENATIGHRTTEHSTYDSGAPHSPVAPKTFPRGNSHIPAMNCTSPPANMDMPTMTLGVWIPRVPTLYIDNRNAVLENENKPLQSLQSVGYVKCGGGDVRRGWVGYPGGSTHFLRVFPV